MMSIILIFFLLALSLYHFYLRYGRKGRLVDKIPGPSTLPLLGNVHQYLQSGEKLWISQRKLIKDYGSIYRIWLGGMAGIGISHPDYVQAVLTSNKNIRKSVAYKFLHPWLNTGLLTSFGEKWRIRRKMLTPAFHFNVLRSFVEVFEEESLKLVQFLKKERNEMVKNIEPIMLRFTLNSICETAMGTSLEKTKEMEEYRSAIQKMGDVLFHRIMRPWLYSDWIFNLTSSGIKQRKALRTLHGFSSAIIRERRGYHEKFPFSEDGKSDPGFFGENKRRMAMLDILLSESMNKGTIDDGGIREEVDTFIFEGHDTTAMCLVFTVALLAEHKEIQEMAREEVSQILDQSGGRIGTSEINNFPYLERCIKESLRLYPSVTVITRMIEEDIQLRDYVVPAGCNIHLYIYDLHRNPEFWPDPEKYDPDRFLPEEIKKRHPFSYVPFSAGSRNCIGQKFAMLELKCVLAQILYHFSLEAVDLAHEVVLIQDLIIRPKQPVRVKFKAIPRCTVFKEGI